MKKNFVAIVDLDVHVAGGFFTEHGPAEWLKSRVAQSIRGVAVPLTASMTGVSLDHDGQNCLDPIQRVVGKERHVEPSTGRHDLISFSEDVDRGCRVGHDLTDQPSLEWADQPVVPSVSDQDRSVLRIICARHNVQEPRHPDLIWVALNSNPWLWSILPAITSSISISSVTSPSTSIIVATSSGRRRERHD